MRNHLIALLFLCPFGILFSQNQKQILEFTSDYDKVELQRLERFALQKAKTEKAQAVKMALEKGWEITTTLPDGSYIELQEISKEGLPIYYTTFNVAAARSTRANHLNAGGSLGLNLNGQGMIAHVWDGGIALASHQEYHGAGGNNRFSVADGSSSINFHAAHVTGTIIASGVDANAKGMAPHAQARGYDWNSDLAEATTAAANGMLISNHSYGYMSDYVPDWWFGAYIDKSRSWDVLLHNSPYYLMVVAAGNDGNSNHNALPNEGNPSYDKLTGHATSKNNMVVANAQDANVDNNGNLNSVNINSSSSQGPTDDYRIKPDITGNGTGVYSTYHSSNTAYNSISGTSMASPNVAGSLLLLQQHHNNVNGAYMRAATLKGLALHTADDVGMAGPDAVYGWGLMNTKRAAEAITANGNTTIINELVLNPGQTYTITVVADGSNPLLASISWTDLPGVVNTGTANATTSRLVNDLDLRLNKSGTNYLPWKMTSVNSNAKMDNNVDPFERVDIANANGTYTITVTHKGSLSGGSQAFTLIVTGVTVGPVDCVATTPTGISSGAVNSTSATISWNAVSGASYDVRYRQVGTTTWTTVSTTSTSRNLTGLQSSTTYEFQVRSKCATTNSNYSGSNNFTTQGQGDDCAVPGGLSAINITQTSATLSWSAVTGSQEYNVRIRKLGVTNWTEGTTTSTSINTSSLLAGDTYEYQVRAVCASGNSNYSAVHQFTTLSTCPIPTSLSSSNITTTGATVSWNAQTLANNYTVRYRTIGSSTWLTQASSGTSLGLTGLSSGANYEFQVRSECTLGLSDYAASALFTTLSSCIVPSGLSSSNLSVSSATVSWSTANGASGYDLRHRVAGTSTWTNTSVSGTSFNLTGLQSSTSYEFQVRSQCGTTNSNYSGSGNFTTQGQGGDCAIPGNLSAINITQTSATLSWSPVTGAQEYNARIRKLGATNWAEGTTTGNSINTSSLLSGDTYEYQVRAVCASGNSNYSGIQQFTTLSTCPIPEGLSSSNITQTNATVSWSAVSGVAGYNMRHRAIGTSNWTTITTAATSSNLTGLLSGTMYEFQVRSQCGTTNSNYSDSSNFTTQGQGDNCAVPGGISAINITQTTATLSWIAVSGALEYNTRIRKAGITNWTEETVVGTSLDITRLFTGDTYEYQVRTVCSSGNSIYSAVQQFTTLSTCPIPVSLSSSNITHTSATVSWSAQSLANSYTVRYRIVGSSSWLTQVASGNSLNLTGLSIGANYEFQVRSDCNSGTSGFADSAQFTTSSSCMVPSGLSSGNLTVSSATVSWSAASSASGYDLRHRAIGTTTWTTITITGTSHNLTGLLTGTAYEFQVRSQCGTTNSNYSGSSNFTTTQGDNCVVPGGLSAINITQTTATLSWNSVTGAQEYNARIRKLGATNWTEGTTTSTSINTSSLLAGDTYEYQVRTVCASGTSNYSTVQQFTTQSTSLNYCASQGNNVNQGWISRVKLNEIDNSTGRNDGYGDFTNLVASIQSGTTTTINFQAGFRSSSSIQFWRVWIDLNQDGQFSSDEMLVSGSSSSANLLVASMNIPSTALTGQTRMRVSMKANSAQTACETFQKGEVEDYTVNIVTTLNSLSSFSEGTEYAEELDDEQTISQVELYPNPASDVIFLKIPGLDLDQSVKVFSASGAMVHEVRPGEDNFSINVSQLVSGMYLIQANTEQGVITERFIVR